MVIKTVVDEMLEGATILEGCCRIKETGNFENVKVLLADIDYDEVSVETISREMAEYYVHTVYTFDYESSSDAGDGRDEYYTEEEDLQIGLNECIVKDNHFVGVRCEAFDRQGCVLLDCPETVISHPRNYGGSKYHSYRDKRFTLIKKS